MADKHTPQQRSYNMSQVRSKNTKPELMVRKFLFSLGFRFRLHDKKLPGKPDIVLPKYKTVVFVHGCFFHGHEGCRYATIPETRTEWWAEKIAGNRRRDNENCDKLQAAGWKVITVYGCELKPSNYASTLLQLEQTLRSQSE
jgi:DNA mismatch endonuclease (patch repair protein)